MALKPLNDAGIVGTSLELSSVADEVGKPLDDSDPVGLVLGARLLALGDGESAGLADVLVAAEGSALGCLFPAKNHHAPTTPRATTKTPTSAMTRAVLLFFFAGPGGVA
jgi:hypothetical protein